MAAHRATTVGRQVTRDHARSVVQQYFRATRRHLVGLGFSDAELAPLDEEMHGYLREQEIVEEEGKIEDAQRFVETHLKADEVYEFYCGLRKAAHDGGRRKARA